MYETTFNTNSLLAPTLNNEILLFTPVPPSHGALKTVLAFPNTYSVGITSLGYQIIWATLAQRQDVDVRRLFTDTKDSLHKKTDLFGLSLSWELDGPVLLDLLEKQNIPIWSHKRKDSDPIVFGGGPVLTANPEPLAPFFDVILLGEGENLLPIFIETILQIKALPRLEKLEILSQIEGIYIPSLYAPKYSNNGTLIGMETINSKVPKSVTKQTWKSNTLSHSTVITPESVWPNIHMIEVVRSCPELCRFCLASYLTLPFRSSSLKDGLIPSVEKGLQATNRIGLLGASVTQHPEFSELLNWLNQDQFNNIRLSVSSVRASTVNPLLTKILSKRGCKSITMAIESGSSKMRNFVNKKLSENEIYASAHYAKEGGLKGLKLYGMVGLPSEEEIDIEATINLLINIKQQTPELRLTFGVSTFVPKAHTPFQWYGLRPEAKKRLKILSKQLNSKGILVRPESYGWSIIQTLLSRSDRRLAPVIAAVRGSQNNLGSWKQAYRQIRETDTNSTNQQLGGLPKLPSWDEVIHQNWETSRVLPWSHLNGPISPEILIQHLQQSLKENDDLIHHS